MQPNEIIVVGFLGALAIMVLCFATGAYDQSTDPSMDPSSGDQFDDGVEPANYEADHPHTTASSSNTPDISSSSNPQVEAG